MGTLYKDILVQSFDGSLNEDTFRYHNDFEGSTTEVTKREVNFIQGSTVVRATLCEDRLDHLQEKLKNCLEVLRDYTQRAEKHISNIKNEKVREESRLAYADQVVHMMEQIGRITTQLIRNDREVDDEMAILCSNFFVGERRQEND